MHLRAQTVHNKTHHRHHLHICLSPLHTVRTSSRRVTRAASKRVERATAHGFQPNVSAGKQYGRQNVAETCSGSHADAAAFRRAALGSTAGRVGPTQLLGQLRTHGPFMLAQWCNGEPVDLALTVKSGVLVTTTRCSPMLPNEYLSESSTTNLLSYTFHKYWSAAAAAACRSLSHCTIAS